MPDEDTQDEASLPVSTWIDRLGGAHGSPGGGAACAVMVALSSALLSMVAGYCTDNPRVADVLIHLDDVRQQALAASEEDSRRSGELGEALRDAGDADSDADADDAVPGAAVNAARSAGDLGGLAVSLIDPLELLVEIAARYLMPDLVVAGESAAAALGGIAATVRADLRLAGAHGADDTAVDEGSSAVKELDAARRRIDVLRAAAAERV